MNLNLDRVTTLDFLLRPLPVQGDPLGIQLRLESVHGALPFLTEPEQERAQAWIRMAEAEQRQYKGRLVWQENQARR